MNKPNIILIVIDTCRFDFFDKAIEDGELNNIESLLSDGVFYRNAISPSNWTVPSHVSLFTGLYPSEHGVHETLNKKQSSSVMSEAKSYQGPWLPEELKAVGYYSRGIVANPNLFKGTGFERGFDSFENIDIFDSILKQRNMVKEKMISRGENGMEVLRMAENFSLKELLRYISHPINIIRLPELYIIYKNFNKILSKSGYPSIKGGDRISSSVNFVNHKEPFFYFLNFMECHDPYTIERGELFAGEAHRMLKDLSGFTHISQKSIRGYREKYKMELKNVDKYIGEITFKLKESGMYENTMIIITSDHGQDFKDANFYGHGVFLSENLIRVPLLIKFPMNKKVEVEYGYQSLVNLHDFIVSVAEGTLDLTFLSQDVVFSEGFGIQEDYNLIFKSEPDVIKKLELLDHRRTLVISNNICIEANNDNGEANIKPFLSQSGKVAKESDISVVLGRLRMFLGSKENDIKIVKR